MPRGRLPKGAKKMENQFVVRAPAEIYNQVRDKADEEGITISDFVLAAIKQILDPPPIVKPEKTFFKICRDLLELLLKKFDTLENLSEETNIKMLARAKSLDDAANWIKKNPWAFEQLIKKV